MAQTNPCPSADSTLVERGYAPANGLEMYYEIHGQGGVPLVLLHGGCMTIDTSFGAMLPALARSRQVIAVEQQGHGHTADIDRPLTFEQEADDTAATLRQLGVEQADVFGFSDGGNVGLGLAIRHADLVRKLIVAGTNFHNDGLHPEVLAWFDQAATNPELDDDELAAFREVYRQVAPNPDDFPRLVTKVMEKTLAFPGWSPAELRAITAPTFVIAGDADILPPEHAVDLFRLRGGGVAGDLAGLPAARLAILPGTLHVGVLSRADWLLPMITEFLAAPVAVAE